MHLPELVYEATYHVMLKPLVDFGAGPSGHRLFAEAIGGAITGRRLTGTLGSGGGDWLCLGPDGFARIDVRLQIQTDDGASIYLQYPGLLSANDAVAAAIRDGTQTDFPDQYLRVSPCFETADPRYAWLTQSLFLAAGHFIAGFGIEYDVFRVL